MAKVLFKHGKKPEGATIIDVTRNTGGFKDLSPFCMAAPPARLFENLWQFSKVYLEHLGPDGMPNEEWYRWRDEGFRVSIPYRYPMGKGAIPQYSYWEGERLGYIEARKRIYAPEYAKNVQGTDALRWLRRYYEKKPDKLVLLDYDAYDHQALGMTLVDVINNPDKKMGHGFVLLMMLEGCLEECIESA